MSELREHTIVTLLNAWHWARDHKAEYALGGMKDYPAYVVCLEAQNAIESELMRRDRKAFMRWMRAGVLESCTPDKYFIGPEYWT